MAWQYSEDYLVEQPAMKLFESLAWQTATAYNQEKLGENGTFGRLSHKEVLLKKIILQKLEAFNPSLPKKVYEQAYQKLSQSSSSKSLVEINYEKYLFLKDGIPVSFENEKGEQVQDKKLKILDFANVANNDFIAIRQLWIQGKNLQKCRPDIIGFVNGIPLLFIELKAVHQKLENAYRDNFLHYKEVIPQLFYYNAFVVLSNGIESRIGSITSKYSFFYEWKRLSENEEGIVALDQIIKGIGEKNRFLDLFENFTLFDRSASLTKIIAQNHQFLGVNQAIAQHQEKENLYKTGKISLEEKQKKGVFWHTQGSGKSYSMIFFCEKVLRKLGGAYTFLIVVDRLELESQIYGRFGAVGACPMSSNKKQDEKSISLIAQNSEHLKELLKQNHRYLFTMIHKFNFNEVITERENIIVLSDEAHRTQNGELAQRLRKALPNASFIGFTGTPLFIGEESTKKIFGDYVSRYNFSRSIKDGATVPLYYENRGEYLSLDRVELNQEIRNLLEEEDLNEAEFEKVNRLISSKYPILRSEDRLRKIAKDVVWHFCNRGYKGKAMFVALDKLTTVKMYNFIQEYWKENIEKLEKELVEITNTELLEQKKQELEWIKETEICVVVSPEQNEIQKFQNEGLDIEFHRKKMNSENLEYRFKEKDDVFRLVIVCAMWLTGFDVPTLSTLYLDKPLKAHTLMQSIARANRVNEGKNNGLIVDYIETYKALLDALAVYGSGEGIDQPIKPKEELIEELEKALENIESFLKNELHFDLNELINAQELEKLALIEQGKDAICRYDADIRKFQVLAREVFKKYKALCPDKLLYQYEDRKNAVEVLYKAIENTTESPDVSEIMSKLQKIVDISVQSMDIEQSEGTKIDISSFDFEKLKEQFANSKHKNTNIQSLKENMEKHLKAKIALNPLSINYYERYQEIIASYNQGKDESVVWDTFRKLIELVNEYSQEEAQTKRQGLSEEQKAVFDILRKDKKLDKNEQKEVKKIALDLLSDLKKEKIKIAQWSEKESTAATVRKYIHDNLFDKLPYPIYETVDIDIKTAMLYEHLKNQYFGGGQSVYGDY